MTRLPAGHRRLRSLSTGKVRRLPLHAHPQLLDIAPSTVRSRALKAWEKAKLQPIGLHEARHTCASILIAAGVNAKALSVIMGHATISMTFDVYGHMMPGGLEAAAASANACLAAGAKRPALRVAG